MILSRRTLCYANAITEMVHSTDIDEKNFQYARQNILTNNLGSRIYPILRKPTDPLITLEPFGLERRENPAFEVYQYPNSDPPNLQPRLHNLQPSILLLLIRPRRFRVGKVPFSLLRLYGRRGRNGDAWRRSCFCDADD